MNPCLCNLLKTMFSPLARIDELLSELEDVSAGERLDTLCKRGLHNKLIKTVREFIKSHLTALKKGKSTVSHFGVVRFVVLFKKKFSQSCPSGF